MYCILEAEIESDDSTQIVGVHGPYSTVKEAEESLNDGELHELDALDYEHVVGSSATLYGDDPEEPTTLYSIKQMI